MLLDDISNLRQSVLAKIGIGFVAGAASIGSLIGITQLNWNSYGSPNAPAAQNAKAKPKIRGNKNSRIYHLPGCPNYDDIAIRNRVYFESHEEAKAAGFRKARNC
jgi:hypothetical protein